MNGASPFHLFAVKWLNKFCDPETNCEELVDHYLADDCKALGFEMDCGHSFEAMYDGASFDVDALRAIISTVNDIFLLGTAIYSRWRYFNHWAYNAAEILMPENREWFIIALTRLAELTAEEKKDIL